LNPIALLVGLASAGVAAYTYKLGQTAAPTPAPAPVPILAPPPPPVAAPPPTPPAAVPAAPGLPPDVSTTIAALLDSRIHAPSSLLEQYAAIAAGPDGKQNPRVVSQLRTKARFMRQEERRAAEPKPVTSETIGQVNALLNPAVKAPPALLLSLADILANGPTGAANADLVQRLRAKAAAGG
jgi:hypothetical protein